MVKSTIQHGYGNFWDTLSRYVSTIYGCIWEKLKEISEECERYGRKLTPQNIELESI